MIKSLTPKEVNYNTSKSEQRMKSPYASGLAASENKDKPTLIASKHTDASKPELYELLDMIEEEISNCEMSFGRLLGKLNPLCIPDLELSKYSASEAPDRASAVGTILQSDLIHLIGLRGLINGTIDRLVL